MINQNSQMEEQEHSAHLPATPTSAGQRGFPQASVDIECIGAEEERVDNVAQAMTAPSVPSRQEPTKLDYVRRLPRVQRDQYAPLYTIIINSYACIRYNFATRVGIS